MAVPVFVASCVYCKYTQGHGLNTDSLYILGKNGSLPGSVSLSHLCALTAVEMY